jgi:hypothetical protein
MPGSGGRSDSRSWACCGRHARAQRPSRCFASHELATASCETEQSPRSTPGNGPRGEDASRRPKWVAARKRRCAAMRRPPRRMPSLREYQARRLGV